jgi:hypothetical protein
MAELTFRDFVAALMQGNKPQAATVLEQLLGLPADQSTRATEHFARQMRDPSFMAKAMALRNAVTSGSDDDIGNILVDSFGLDDAQRATAVAAVRKRYPAPS